MRSLGQPQSKPSLWINTKPFLVIFIALLYTKVLATTLHVSDEQYIIDVNTASFRMLRLPGEKRCQVDHLKRESVRVSEVIDWIIK